MRYIVLLRGINVGGKNTVAMPKLRQLFTALGYQQVITYINSGNILFVSPKKAEDLQSEIRQAILDTFAIALDLAVLTAEELTEALCQAPSWWNDDPGSKHNAIFVIAPASSAMIMNEAGETKPAYEQVAYSGSVIFWSAPLATFTKTRWSGIVKSSVYPSITIRNRNTALKLQALANQLKED